MGLIRDLVALPVRPVTAVGVGAFGWAVDRIHEEAARQWSDPSTIRSQLAEIDALRDAGEIDEAEAEAGEEQLLQRLIASTAPQGVQLEPPEGGSHD